jgi:DNA repair protein SbcD/Mre11
MKFLHIADVHLGCTRYQLPESPRDFFTAWIDVMKRYGIDEKVDFVIICGDFFHKKAVPPETMNHAVEGLTMMREAGIPVIAIEGNHDQKHTDSEFSWLRSLSKWGLVTLLEPTTLAERITYEPWDESARKGGYIDIGRARIFGSDWYGAAGNVAIPLLTEAVRQNRRDGGFHILMLHTDVEGHQVHPIPALSMDAFRQLRSAVEYVGLGHTHRHYEIDNWAFNPGSIEVTNISEYREVRGAFVVEVDNTNTVRATHVDDYRYRPFRQLVFDVGVYDDPKVLSTDLLRKVESETSQPDHTGPAPIVEITLKGQLGFPNSLLELQKIRDEARRLIGALHVRIKNQTVPADYLDSAAELDDAGREKLERRVVADLVRRDSRFKDRPEDIAELVVGAKRMALGDEPPDKIAELVAQKACQN